MKPSPWLSKEFISGERWVAGLGLFHVVTSTRRKGGLGSRGEAALNRASRGWLR